MFFFKLVINALIFFNEKSATNFVELFDLDCEISRIFYINFHIMLPFIYSLEIVRQTSYFFQTYFQFVPGKIYKLKTDNCYKKSANICKAPNYLIPCISMH